VGGLVWWENNSKMANGRHFENQYIAISVKNHQIFMKFCTQQQILILNWMNVT